MPQVPVYKTQVATRALPSVTVRAPQPGNGAQALGAGLRDAGTGLDALARRQQEQFNADTVFRAEAALKDEYREFEAAQRERRGRDAVGITDDVDTWFKEAQKRHSEALENDAQRFMFGQTFGNLRGSALDSASKYESAQRAVSLEDAAKSSIESSINTAAAQFNDADAVATQKQDILKRIDVQAGFNGWTPERIEAEKQATLTRLHAGVIRAAVDADPEYAREYFAANKGEIAGTVQDDMQSLLDAGSLKATAQRATDEILAENMSETDALKRARENYEGDERDEIVTRLKTRYAEARAAEAEQERALADEAWDIFARTGTVSSLPTSLLEELDGRTLQALKNAESGEAVDTDWARYYELRQEALANPEAFAALDLRKEFPNMRASERRQLIAIQEQLRTPEALPDAATTEQQISVALNTLEIDDKDKKGQFTGAVYEGIAAFTSNVGREPTYDERQQIIDRMTMSGEVIDGLLGFVDKDVEFFQVAGTEASLRFEPEGGWDISDAERAQIVDAMERKNVPVSEEAIVTAYRKLHGLF